MRHVLEAWSRELAHGARGLVRSPGFAVVTIVTLALAIGANTAVFSVVDTVLIRPLPFPDPDRLVSIRGTAPGSDLPEEFGVGTEFYVQYRENAAALEDLALFQEGQTTVRAGENVERLFVSAASPSLYTTLGVTPEIGRLPTEADEEGQVAVLSHWLWTSWFGADPAVLGSAIEVSGRLVDILGVMGPEFRFPEARTSLWIHDLPTEPIRPGGFGLNLVGRVAPGVDHDALVAELDVLAKRLPERFGGPPAYADIIDRHRPVVRSLEEELVGDIEAPLWILLGTVVIVLLVACANVANLLIVRAEGRRLDLAIRRALGAGRVGLVRSQMSETLILSAVGGLGGIALAWLGVPLLVGAAPEGIPRLEAVRIDATALLFTAGVVLLAALLAGLLPAIRFSNPQLAGGLRETGRVGSGPNHLLRDGLVVLQTSAALVLLVSSGLLLQSFRALHEVDPGYDTEDIFTFQAAPDPREHGLTDAPTFARFHYLFMDRLAALPGVERVGLANTLPLDEGAGAIQVVGEAMAGEDAPQPMIRFTMVGGDYFRTMGIQLLSGRYLERSDQVPAEVEAIVSESAAELIWPEGSPLGRRLRVAADSSGNWVRIVGVVEDILLSDLRQERPDPMLYLPMVGFAERTWVVGTPAYVVRTSRAEAIAPDVRELVREVAPQAPMYRVFTMRGLAARSASRLSFTMLTLAVAAGLALILGAVGLFGVLSYVVSRRTREIGIRMALGAEVRELRRMVVAQGGRVAGLGVGLGVVVAVALTRVLESLLFGVEAIDVPTYVAVSLLMLVVAVAASYIPARRASAVDPMRALRTE
jgi:predicted permease